MRRSLAHAGDAADREKQDRGDQHARGIEGLRVDFREGVLDDRVVGAPDERHQEQQDIDGREAAGRHDKRPIDR